MLKDHKELRDMISTAETYRDTLLDLMKMDVSDTWGLSYDKLEEIKSLSIMDIMMMNENDIKDEYFQDNAFETECLIDVTSRLNEVYTPELKERLKSEIEKELLSKVDDQYPTEANIDVDTIIEIGDINKNKLIILSLIRMDMHDIIDMDKTIEESRIQLDESVAELAEYINSEEYQSKKEDTYKKFIEKYNEEVDPDKRKKMETVISTMHSIKSLSFITDRIDKYGDDEIKVIADSFLDKDKSDYVYKKYKSKIKQMKITELHDIHLKFVNIEVNFLDEEYHSFNNLFLFVVMRFIAYSDMHNKEEVMYVNRIMIMISKLLGNRLNVDDRIKFIETINHILSKFKPYTDIFDEKNITSYKNLIYNNKDLIEKTVSSLMNDSIDTDGDL